MHLPRAQFWLGACALGFVVVASAGAQPPDNGRARAILLIEKADAAAAAGRDSEALTLLEEAARAAPEWPELMVNLAAARSEAGDYAGAAAAARAALALDGSLDGARFNLGLALLKAGDAAGAVEALAPYREAAAPPVVHAALGLALMQLDRAGDAAPLLQRGIDAGVRDRDTLLAAGRAWLQLDDLDRARGAVRLLETEAGSWIQARILAGDMADAEQDWFAAAAQYRAALDLEPDSAQARYSLGLVLYKQREYESAASELERALELAPAHVPAHYYLGQLELDRGNPARAADLLARAAELAPQRADVARDLGRARIDLGEVDQALASLQRAVRLAPEDPSAWFLLARALQHSGRSEESHAALDRATQLNQARRDQLEQRVSGVKRPPD